MYYITSTREFDIIFQSTETDIIEDILLKWKDIVLNKEDIVYKFNGITYSFDNQLIRQILLEENIYKSKLDLTYSQINRYIEDFILRKLTLIYRP